GPEKDTKPAAAGAWRGVAGAWWWFLPHPEIPGGAGVFARAPDLVQMGELRDLAIGRDAAGAALLCRGGPVPHRPQCARRAQLGRDPLVGRLHRAGLAAL